MNILEVTSLKMKMEYTEDLHTCDRCDYWQTEPYKEEENHYVLLIPLKIYELVHKEDVRTLLIMVK